jgi:Fic family protein
VAELVRPMNSYYSNLIEGHDTHPLDIDRALRSEYAKDKKNRDLQLEAVAHINVHRGLHDRWRAGSAPANPADPEFLKELHAAFYEHLPDTFKLVANKNGPPRTLVPGAFRDGEVEVGRHIAPAHEKVPAFMDRFGSFYDPKAAANRSALRRIIAIAAAHHRLVWIHPVLDGNGRVVRLFSDACFLNEQLDAAGLWSISRGLARSRDTYRDMLAAGFAEEHARGILPFDYRQHFVVSFSLRAFLHFMDLRAKLDAQEEIRVLCDLMWPHMQAWAPEIAGWYEKSRLHKARLAP